MTWSWQGNRWGTIFGLVVLVALGAYLMFSLINSAELTVHEGAATIVDKGYRKGGTSYFTVMVKDTPIVRPQDRPDMYLVKLQLEGQEVVCPVTRQQYDAAVAGETIHVHYKRARLTGRLWVVEPGMRD